MLKVSMFGFSRGLSFRPVYGLLLAVASHGFVSVFIPDVSPLLIRTAVLLD